MPILLRCYTFFPEKLMSFGYKCIPFTLRLLFARILSFSQSSEYIKVKSVYCKRTHCRPDASECFPLEMWTKLTVIDLFIFIEIFSGSCIVDILSKKKIGAYKTQLCFIRGSFLINIKFSFFICYINCLWFPKRKKGKFVYIWKCS